MSRHAAALAQAPAAEPLGDRIVGWEAPPPDRSRHRKQLRQCCQVLRSTWPFGFDPQRVAAVAVINRWRLAHHFPLNTFQLTLRRFASRAQGSPALVVQRIKRMETIEDKLLRFPDLNVDTMQDLGGCRAIMATIDGVRKLSDKYESFVDKPGKFIHERVKHDDYIKEPKDDGYRSIHYIYKYQGTGAQSAAWDGLKIEIQIRTMRQHAWAAAIETVDLFTQQRLKYGGGEPEWRRLFLLMSSVMAIEEACPPVKGTPGDIDEMSREIAELARSLDVLKKMSLWSNVANHLVTSQRTKFARHYVLQIDADSSQVSIVGYGSIKDSKDIAALSALKAAEKLLEEEAAKPGPRSSVVLVGAKSLADVKAAYPSYLANTSEFLEVMQRAVAKGRP